jgi:hypothetical protein
MRVFLVLLLLASAIASAAARAQTPVPPPVPAPDAPDDIGPPPKPEEAPPPPPPEEAPAPPPEEQAKKQDISPPDAWVARTTATLRVMNKIDSTVQSLTVPVGGTGQYESLSIKVSGCFVRPPDLPADAAAHVDITDNRPDQPGLNAWILKNEPALNMLQHPVYDVQLAGCA